MATAIASFLGTPARRRLVALAQEAFPDDEEVRGLSDVDPAPPVVVALTASAALMAGGSLLYWLWRRRRLSAPPALGPATPPEPR